MINLRSINRTDSDDIENIISEKNKGVIKTSLQGLKLKIVDRYSNYIEIESNKRISPIAFTLDEKNALSSLYESKTKTAKKIINEVLDILNPNHSDCCLYCGIGEIDQIDHYLPQEHFPEFSILHKNLIPICGKCNEIKGANIPGAYGKDYMHLVYDIIPIETFYKCEIFYQTQIPKIVFTVVLKFTNSILRIHFDQLKLKPRIEKKAVQYSLQIKALKEQFGIAYAAEELQRDLTKSTAFFGLFYWKTELINEMIKTDFANSVT